MYSVTEIEKLSSVVRGRFSDIAPVGIKREVFTSNERNYLILQSDKLRNSDGIFFHRKEKNP